MRRLMGIAAMMLLAVSCGCHHEDTGTVVTETPSTPTTTSTPVPPRPVPDAGPGDKAVCVGINKYPGNELSGCVNDATDMRNFLIKIYGFKSSQIKLLTDGDATCENIKAALVWLAADAKPGDRRVFHYSGHGAEDAVENFQNDPDHLNQMICPVDFDWSPDHEIIDKQFVQIFSPISEGVLFNWVSDSCHSGDLDRAIPRNGKKIKSRQFPTVPDAVKKRIAAVKAKKNFTRGIMGSGLNVGFVSGCKADQTSADTQDENGRPCGALTNYFLTSMKTLGDSPLKDVVSDVDNNLARDQYDQQPQAEGPRAVKPFLK